MKLSKAILFDWGGVIETYERNVKDIYTYEHLYAESLVTIFPQLQKYSVAELFDNFYAGSWENVVNTSIKSYIDFIRGRLHVLGLDESLAELFVETTIANSDKVDYNQFIVLYLYQLRKRCITGVLSDLCVVDVPRIKAQIKPKYVDKYYLSCELGLSKHHNTIFKYVTDDLGIKPHNILFFDDKGANVDRAKDCGWNAVQATAFELDYIKEVCEDFLTMEESFK